MTQLFKAVTCILLLACSVDGAAREPAKDAEEFKLLLGDWISHNQKDLIVLNWLVEEDSNRRELLVAAIVTLGGLSIASEDMINLELLAGRFSEREKAQRQAELLSFRSSPRTHVRRLRDHLRKVEFKKPEYFDGWAEKLLRPWGDDGSDLIYPKRYREKEVDP